MRKAVLLLALLLPLVSHAQISGAGSLGCSGVATAGTVINSSLANNTVVSSLSNFQAWGVLVQLDQTTTITGGVVTFQESFDGGANYITVPVAQVLNVSTFAQLTNPYTLVASTNQGFLIVLYGATNFQVKLTTAMTGTGAITPYLTTICEAAQAIVLDLSGNQKVNIAAQSLSKVLVTPDADVETIPVTTATTTNAASTCYLTSAASTNSTSCKGSAGNVYGIYLINTTTTNYFLRMYNSASAPTCSSATGFVETIPALGGAANGGGISRVQAPQGYATGIGFCLTGGGSSTDNTNAATGVYITILFK